MSSAKHTPGPWVVGTDTARGADRGRVHILGNTGGELVRIAAAQTPADARLIAAAPEMLTVLHAVVAAHDATAGAVPAYVNTARRAIAKAEGNG